MRIQAIKQPPREITLNKQQAKEHREHEIQAYTNIKKPLDKYQSNLDTKSRFNPTRIHDRYKVNKLSGKSELHKENFHVLNRIHQAGGGKVNLGKSDSGKRLRYDPHSASATQTSTFSAPADSSREITLNSKQAQDHQNAEMQSYEKLSEQRNKIIQSHRQKWPFNFTRRRDQRKHDEISNKQTLHFENYNKLAKLVQNGGTITLGKSLSGNRFKYSNPRSTPADQS